MKISNFVAEATKFGFKVALEVKCIESASSQTYESHI